jgi:hypothetical protein
MGRTTDGNERRFYLSIALELEGGSLWLLIGLVW